MAGFALIIWPLVALVFFAFLGPARGLIWSAVAGYLFLPENYGFDIPSLSYNKDAALALGWLLGAAFFSNRQAQAATLVDRRFKAIMLVLLAAFFLSALGTWITNPDPVIAGPTVRPPVSIADLVGMFTNGLVQLIPFFLAWYLLLKPEHHREILVAFLAFGMFYTFLALIELRLSPQLNLWIYGYFPHSWQQHVRSGGFRPLIFLRHGLELGLFLFYVVIAGCVLARQSSGKPRIIFALSVVLVFAVLFLSRNLGAFLLVILLVPVVLMFSGRAQAQIAAVVVLVFLSLPALRQSGILTFEQTARAVEVLSADRAGSLRFRLENEKALLERALERPAFGWGGWSRARVFDEEGYDISVTDGLWVIVIGQRGWVGYLAYFGLMTVPVLFIAWSRRRREIPLATAGLITITAGNLIYFVPNAFLGAAGWLVFGALAGFVRWSPEPEQPVTPKQEGRQSKVRYTRFEGPEKSQPLHTRGPSPLN